MINKQTINAENDNFQLTFLNHIFSSFSSVKFESWYDENANTIDTINGAI